MFIKNSLKKGQPQKRIHSSTLIHKEYNKQNYINAFQ